MLNMHNKYKICGLCTQEICSLLEDTGNNLVNKFIMTNRVKCCKIYKYHEVMKSGGWKL